VATPADVARTSDIVLFSLTDTDAVRSVVFGKGGLAEGTAPDKLLIDMSSIIPAASAEMAAKLIAETGMGWVDAPVSGGPANCQAGTLVVMAGGSGEDFARAEAVLNDLAQRLTHMGPAGAGQATKLANQIFVGGYLTLTAEAFLLTEKAGVDVARLPAALAGGRADSVVLQEWGPRMAAGDFSPTGTVNILDKDLKVIADTAEASGLTLPAAMAARDMYRRAAEMGFGDEDVCAVIKAYDTEIS
jgi:3-hydroxyisobutyrate dehydrogenase-like beta-hydroxyacid dehydrogenase